MILAGSGAGGIGASKGNEQSSTKSSHAGKLVNHECRRRPYATAVDNSIINYYCSRVHTPATDRHKAAVEFVRSSWRETLFKLNSPSRLGGKLCSS